MGKVYDQQSYQNFVSKENSKREVSKAENNKQTDLSYNNTIIKFWSFWRVALVYYLLSEEVYFKTSTQKKINNGKFYQNIIYVFIIFLV